MTPISISFRSSTLLFSKSRGNCDKSTSYGPRSKYPRYFYRQSSLFLPLYIFIECKVASQPTFWEVCFQSIDLQFAAEPGEFLVLLFLQCQFIPQSFQIHQNFSIFLWNSCIFISVIQGTTGKKISGSLSSPRWEFASATSFL